MIHSTAGDQTETLAYSNEEDLLSVGKSLCPNRCHYLGESSQLLACVLICSWQKLISGAFPGQWEFLPWPDNYYGLPLT